MKLVRQTKLYFQEGSSDKVYEIDLCESGDGFIVNFRYGRRGAALKDGTKTIFPVPLAEAEKIFAALEQEKRKKGYVAAGEAPIVVSSEPRPSASGDKRKKAIVKILKAAAAGEEPENWKLSRVIWRAGDLKIQEALPSIIKLADTQDPFTLYSIIWAIGRCGSVNHLSFLQSLQAKTNLLPHTRQLLFEAILKYSEGKEKEILIQSIIQTLPAPIQKSVVEKNYRQLSKNLREYLFELKTTSNEYLVALYQLARHDTNLYRVFLPVLEEIPLALNYFKHIRHIFKTAEMVEDYTTYGVIAKNIEKTSAAYRSSPWAGPDHKVGKAFSSKTKSYLADRVLRFLEKYGEASELTYTEFAGEILMAFNDAKDLTPPYQKTDVSYAYDSNTRRHNRVEKTTHFDQYATFQAFNFILYKNSSRYIPGKNAWSCLPPYVPGNGAPANREEAYPHLWDKTPEEIIRLLAASQSQRVHEFAIKVFKANASFENSVDIAHVVAFLQTPFVTTQQLGLSLARKKYDRLSPDKVLLAAMLDSSLTEAREQATQWINDEKRSLLSDSEFIFTLLNLKRAEAHEWLRTFLASASLPKEQAELIAAKVIAQLVTLEIETDEEKRIVRQLSETLVISFASVLRYVSIDIIKDLFRHKSEEIHALAGKILMQHEIKAEELPEDFLQILLQSSNEHSRSLGISLLGKFPEDRLLKRKDVLVSFCISPLPDVRNAVKPLIFKLVKAYPDFGKELIDLFVPAFLMKESYEGLHEDLLSLLANELSESLSVIPKERSLLLLQSKFKAAQQMGLVLLRKNIKPEELTVADLVKISNNPQQEARMYAWDTFKNAIDKVKASKEDAIKMTDSHWDDTRIFAFDYFRNNFSDTDWNTDLLVTLCDSVRDDVEAFGREMITRFFNAENGKEYLLKLSQHPSTKVQLFTTTYLEKYATDNFDSMQKLKPYFITLLSQVNKGRVAKMRVMDFLKKQSLKDEQTATLIAEIMTRVSVSVAIREKAECVALLRDIQSRFPAIKTPVIVKPYSDYTKA